MKRLHIFLADHARRVVKLIVVLAFAFTPLASAQTNRYVVKDNSIPLWPYTNWTDAAANIQDAISACSSGDVVWVTNDASKVYDTGGVTNWPAGSALTNRIAITTAYITVRSANNDPTNTIIKGAWDTATNGDAAVRCVYLANYSKLIGFTLTNGATLGSWPTTNNNYHAGGGVWCPSTNAIISNCVIAGNSAYLSGGGAYSGTLYNCTLTRNSATYGGGAYGGTLYNCTLFTNIVKATTVAWTGCGGGAYGGTLYNCTLISNSAPGSGGYGGGGGAYNGTLYNCTLTGNSAGQYYGGGACYGTLYNCTLVRNSAANSGGGTREATLYNCTLTGNSAVVYGGGAYGGTLSNCTLLNNTAGYNGGGVTAAGVTLLYNCTLSGNSAGSINGGGGASGGTLYNCILTNNSATKYGGGANGSILYNCLLINNSAPHGGGSLGGALYNCTLANNSASVQGGGASSNTLNNCIVYFNSAPAGSNWNEGDATIAFTNSCTAPLPAGDGNITANPMFVDTNTANYRLNNNSPCINAGTNGSWTTNTVDLDGHRRIIHGTVDIGAYEHIHEGTVFTVY